MSLLVMIINGSRYKKIHGSRLSIIILIFVIVVVILKIELFYPDHVSCRLTLLSCVSTSYCNDMSPYVSYHSSYLGLLGSNVSGGGCSTSKFRAGPKGLAASGVVTGVPGARLGFLAAAGELPRGFPAGAGEPTRGPRGRAPSPLGTPPHCAPTPSPPGFASRRGGCLGGVPWALGGMLFRCGFAERQPSASSFGVGPEGLAAEVGGRTGALGGVAAAFTEVSTLGVLSACLGLGLPGLDPG